MSTKIGNTKGFDIFYDSILQRFELWDPLGNVVTTADTQKEAEKKAAVLAKTAGSFPIKAFLLYAGLLHPGRITSFDAEDEKVWFVWDKATYGHRERRSITYDHLYLMTDHNTEVANKLAARATQVEDLRTEIAKETKLLTPTLTDPVDMNYFSKLLSKQSQK